jgi:hypothetical protein
LIFPARDQPFSAKIGGDFRPRIEPLAERIEVDDLELLAEGPEPRLGTPRRSGIWPPSNPRACA